MCLAIPAEVIHIEADQALVSLGGIKKEISLALVDNVFVGDYVLLHVGYALNKIDPDEAKKTLALFKAAGVFEVDT
ncbi:MAG: HypC/HybG/HupF family hydrogenase formation chaperone [Gammaproteobacteria bacterium]|nr:HypC/HybG/HupF family hydrogenase formation chaperone [Gammaproteobacteria bacterium]MDH5731877.1 HypC/HybG/HupF family hydrogenase formation chaperone [Gammaproteobacteria bacterium]